MHRKQDVAFFDTAFIALRFIFGNTHSDQRSDQSADRSAGAKARQRSHDWTRSDEWSKPRNG